MSQSITIACPSAWRLESFAKALEAIAHEQKSQLSKFDQQWQLIAEDHRWKLIINEVPDLAATAVEYATNDYLDERFRGEVGTLRFFTIRFDDVDVTRRFLRFIAQKAVSDGETVWIDTDYGWVIAASAFLKRTERDACWDWRKAPDEL